MTNLLQLTLFGSPEVHLHGQAVTGFRSSKAQALLYYLAATGRSHMRPTLASLFWGDQPEAAARTSLSKCLSNLRDLVGDAVLVDRQTVTFNRNQPYYLDTEHFLAGMGQAPTLETIHTWQAALALYRGDFLEGFYVREAPDFEQWVLVQRAHYREAVLQGLHILANWYDQQGDLSQAISHTRRLLTLEPWCEEAHRQLMTRLARNGQRAAALVQFETCRQILVEELAVEPDAETLEIVDAIRSGAFDQIYPGENHRTSDQLAASVTPSLPPPTAHNLPLPPTPLIGRVVELKALGTLINDPQCRFITITGPGGIGKTRLALAAANEQMKHFRDSAVFVPLAAITDPTFLAHTLLQGLAQPLQEPQDPATQLVDYLRSKQMLLLLDNYEQLLPEIALLQTLLTQAPGLTLLVTSRERLALQAEQLFPLEGLNYPDPAATEKWEEYSAIQLFLQRARQIKLGFVPTAEELTAIILICRISEGLPLAIELAAGALRTQSTIAIVNALSSSQPLPATRLRDLPARHRSIQTVFDHSWQLLTTEEQTVLAQLSVFRGGFVLAAVEQVTTATIEQLAALVDKSLVRQLAGDRFDLHELLRQFAADKLNESGKEADTHGRHLAYFLALAEQLEPKIMGAPSDEAVAHFTGEYDNFRAALEWGLSQSLSSSQVATTAAWLAARLGRYWHLGRHRREGLSWLGNALTVVEKARQAAHQDDSDWATDERKLYALLLFHAGMLQPDSATSQRLLEQSLHHYRILQDQRALMRCLQELAFAVSDLGQPEQAKAWFSEGLAYARHLNDPWSVARSLMGLATLYLEENQPEVGLQLAEEVLAIYRQQRDSHNTPNAMVALAQAHLALGHYQQAAALLEEALVLRRIVAPGSKGGPWAYRVLGQVEQFQGNYRRAAEYYRRSLLLRQEQGQVSGLAWALEGLVEVAVLLEQPLQAAHLGGAAERLRQEVGSLITADDLPRYQQAIQQANAALGETKFQAAWATGSALTVEEVVAYALADSPDV